MKYIFMFEYRYHFNKNRVLVDWLRAKTKEEAIIRFFHLHGGKGYRIEHIYIESTDGWFQIL